MFLFLSSLCRTLSRSAFHLLCFSLAFSDSLRVSTRVWTRGRRVKEMLPGLGCLVRVLLGQAGESMQGGAGAQAPESSLATTNFTGLLTIRLSL